jgi:protein gp37
MRVNTASLFMRRLFDEMIRFPKKRQQILTQTVARLGTIVEPLRQGDQYIVPESSTSWLNMLRLEWMAKVPEKPQFYEEMHRMRAEGEKAS